MFDLEFLDHVAIRVKDLNISSDWYKNILGLKRISIPEWEPFPIMLMAGNSGVALFPANIDHPAVNPSLRGVKIDHFAFRLSNENFQKAQGHLKKLNIDFVFQDHLVFHSIYLIDPDGHTVELTTEVEKDNA